MKIWFIDITTRKYCQIKENNKWSKEWYCNEIDCPCGEYEFLKDEVYRKVPFYKRVSIYNVNGLYVILWFFIWFFIWLIK